MKQQELDKERYKKLAKSGYVVAEFVTQELDARVEKYNQEQKKYNWLVPAPIVLLNFIFIVQFWIQGFDGWVFHPRVWPGTFGISNA
jgi:hypothetical protein